jgi:hypothetical protein
MLRALAFFVFLSLGVSLSYGTVDTVLAKKDATAQKDASASEDGQSTTDEGSVEGSATMDGSTTTTTTAPTVPVGANLTPPVGALPAITHPAGTGQSGSSSVSMAPGTLTSGVAREDRNAVHDAPSEPAPEPAPEAAVSACTDFPTWYDAQLTLESSTDADTINSLDPDGDAIACEEVMYPDS